MKQYKTPTYQIYLMTEDVLMASVEPDNVDGDFVVDMPSSWFGTN